MFYADKLKSNIEASIAAKHLLLSNEEFLKAFESTVMRIINCYQKGGRLYIAGNGGSAADAQHLACEFVVRMARDRAPIPAEALTVDGSILTAIGNDYGFEYIFARQLAGKAGVHDLFMAISTSGHSPNILNALVQCRAMGLPSILLTGRDSGKAGTLADYVLNVGGDQTNIIQEQHVIVYHALCECVEAAICNA